MTPLNSVKDAGNSAKPMLSSAAHFLAAALPAVFLSACRTSRRPNFLFVLADDQSFPHQERMAARAFAHRVRPRKPTTASSSPTRSARRLPVRHPAAPFSPDATCGRWRKAGLLYGTIRRSIPWSLICSKMPGYHVGYTGKGWGPGDWQAGGLRRNPTGKEYNSRLYPHLLATAWILATMRRTSPIFLRQRPAQSPFFFWFGSTEPHRVYARGARQRDRSQRRGSHRAGLLARHSRGPQRHSGLLTPRSNGSIGNLPARSASWKRLANSITR
jgi:uncharacterized sulfatase